MKHIRPILFLITILLTTSCSVSYLTVTDEVIPPKIEFPTHIKSVILLNRSLEQDLVERLSSGVINDPSHKEIIRYVVNKMPINAKAHHKTVRDSKLGEPADPFTVEDVSRYGAGYDGLFCLEQQHHSENRTYNFYKKHQLDEQGKDYYIDAVRGARVTTFQSFWRLYEVESGKIMLQLPYQIVDDLEAEALSRQGLNAKFDTLNVPDPDIMKYKLADALIQDLSPTLIQSSWMYYKKGNDDIKKSAKYFKEKQYSFVIQTLERKMNRYSDKTRLRAMYNVATAYYLNGDYDKALKIAQQGDKATKKSNFKNLITKFNN